MRVPPGGRMGIPTCGGIHGLEPWVLRQKNTQTQKQNKQLKRYADLLEEQLELEFRGYRRPKRVAPPEPPRKQETIIKGGIDVRARRPNTDT